MPTAAPPPERAHVCVVRPPGYLHSLVLADPARYLQDRLTAAGVPTTFGANRLRHDAVNFVFGAHLGFDPQWAREFDVVLVNLEQLGDGGAAVTPQYLDLLRTCRAVDYDAGNVSAYADDPCDVPLLTVGYAPYLGAAPPVPWDEREIDVLFVGGMNERRRDVLERIGATGVGLVVFDAPVYGAERDEVVRQSRCVVNVSYYASGRFEQVRASVVMSNGTPLVSERRADLADVPPAYRDSVLWFDPERPEHFFGSFLRTREFEERAEAALAAFRASARDDDVLDLWRRVRRGSGRPPAVQPSPPRILTADPWRDGRRPGWLTVGDADGDVVAAPGRVPAPRTSTERFGDLDLLGALDVVRLGRVEGLGAAELAARLAEAGRLLAEDGVVVLEWPVGARASLLEEAVSRAWVLDPCYRFTLHHQGRVDDGGVPTAPNGTPAWLRLVLRRTRVSSAGWGRAAAERPDLGTGAPLPG